MPLRILLALTVWLAIPSVSRAEVTAEQVREAIAGGTGEPVDSPVIQKSLDYLRKLSDPKMTYCAALQIMAMDIRAVDKVEPLTLVRAQPEDTTLPFSGLPADGTTADKYTGWGLPPRRC